MHEQVIEPALLYLDHKFVPGARVEITADGRFGRVGTFEGQTTRALPNTALMPGFVTAHSHAFQRGLRGLGDRFPASAERNAEDPSGFFAWREAMYALVDRLTPEVVYTLSVRCFAEMRAAGFTSVGEFHYTRHASAQERFAFDEQVVRAASEAGIRLVLIDTYYQTGGIGQPLRGGQERFETRTVDEYMAQHDKLESLCRGQGFGIAMCAHSVRAAPVEAIRVLHAESVRRGQPFHMHVEEVAAETKACEAAYGKRPMQLLCDEIEIDSRFTAVHCTHTNAEDMFRFGARGGRVCLCPLTEGNLGDGVPDLPGMVQSGAGLCIGTDLNARISPFEEVRSLEYVQRVADERRGVVRDAHGRTAEPLLAIATLGGAQALGLDAGTIATGRLADLCAVNLNHANLAGTGHLELPAALVYGCSTEVVEATCVGGRWGDTMAPR
jgi:formimidoylglutamate deiminase